MLAKEFYLGNTRIKIFDDYAVKTPEQVQQILKRCAEIAGNEERRQHLESAES